ncbi:hypothetical protein [Caenispirillum bisanense]|uniref:Uncharacterized protein n=1 Tax=Caenispirillum bisanense TaxID=414052 RepID=A0A286GTD1_9PROT|nr:hypothetical protein [Caenispirillum bisanense]SOD98795.1 hypothetical protein SAMN05421508_10887 [Caenispirillum bisanense]
MIITRRSAAVTFAAAWLLLLLVAVPGAKAAPDTLPGRYAVQGIGADGATTYGGEAVVEATGETYKVTWLLPGGQVYVGTGIRQGESFAVTYLNARAEGASAPGIVLYTVRPDGSLTGIYSQLGSATISAEAWNPKGT